MLKQFPVPRGYQFRPTIHDIFFVFLIPVVHKGDPLPSPFVCVEIYGENKEPWNVFDTETRRSFWVFTKLRKKSKSRIDRTAGCGCWLARSTKEVLDKKGRVLGIHKYFTFTTKNDRTTNQGNGHWVMHEFSLKCRDSYDWVICEIKNRGAKKSNDGGMSSDPEFSNSDDYSYSQTRDIDAMDLDLNLYPKLNNEKKSQVSNNSSKDDVCRIQNNNDVDSNDEETGPIPELSLNREDSNDDNISYKQKNEDVACSDPKPKSVSAYQNPTEEDSDEPNQQNSKQIEDTNSLHLERQESSISNDSPWQILSKFIDEADEVDPEIILKGLDLTSKDPD
ncbi:hypothetical protein F3Y22_tig00002866pilonHSYRG00039 [Hibiscus syriacus]|uniref:NAC domain-containing protein n=1 Tax=Hibiscus syriacus TaxID=106335 RepID=A0A6A3CN00_HIBSY|nr:hypothetical protein F3Y22_tig00002866pilonHSYRG00039 [Hibiscus syriacus]